MKHGEAIILLHGWCRGKNAESVYEKTITALERAGYTVYTPSFPGFWQTKDPQHALYLQDYAAFLDTFIIKHHIHAPILIGHSFGGRVAIKYVTTKHTDVRSLILTGTPGYSPVSTLKMMLSRVIAKLGSFFFSFPGLSKFADGIRAKFYYVIGARDYYRASGTMRQTFKNIVEEQLEEPMKKIHLPTLLVWGSDDVIVPLSIARRMEKTICGSSLQVISSAGHAVLIDEPVKFTTIVNTFLQSL